MQKGPEQDKWSAEVDQFGSMKPHAQACLANVLTHPDAKAALHKDTNDPADKNSTSKRVKFLDYLQFEVMPKLQRQEPANEKGIELKELLGSEGFKLYQEAAEEEVRSQAFREAVFQKATNHYDGPTWTQRLIAPFGGPSAAGKSVSQPALVAEISKHMPTGEDNSGNDVVSIDGGVEREVSQIRGMVLQVALAKGYKGITDLDKHKPDTVVKKIVEKTVLATPSLNMIIPETYTDEAVNIIKGINGRGTVGKDEFEDYDKVDNGTAILAFGIVEADHDNVVKNGESRAWNAKDFTEADIKMNSKPPCESKAYHDHYKAGTTLSAAAKENYLHLAQADSKPRICVVVKSDFTFIKPDPKAPGGWTLASPEEDWNKSMVGILKRDFEKYQTQAQARLEQLNDQMKKFKINADNLKEFIKPIIIEVNKAGIDPQEKITKQKMLDSLTRQLEETLAKLNETMDELCSPKMTDVKGWLSDNGWAPPLISVQSKEPKYKETAEKPLKAIIKRIARSESVTERRSIYPAFLKARRTKSAGDVVHEKPAAKEDRPKNDKNLPAKH